MNGNEDRDAAAACRERGAAMDGTITEAERKRRYRREAFGQAEVVGQANKFWGLEMAQSSRAESGDSQSSKG
jgi:hypothetical protein